jgi:hypothetical protein
MLIFFCLFPADFMFVRPTRIHIWYVGWIIFNTKFYVEFRVCISLSVPLCICETNDSSM